jgi:C1A family cysteine protease
MVGLLIYEDFYSYKDGIYKYTTGGLIGGHAIRAVGWGHDKEDHLYWIVQNQWTSNWGNKGYAKIKAGEIGIDTWSMSCMPDITIQN